MWNATPPPGPFQGPRPGVAADRHSAHRRRNPCRHTRIPRPARPHPGVPDRLPAPKTKNYKPKKNSAKPNSTTPRSVRPRRKPWRPPSNAPNSRRNSMRRFCSSGRGSCVEVLALVVIVAVAAVPFGFRVGVQGRNVTPTRGSATRPTKAVRGVAEDAGRAESRCGGAGRVKGAARRGSSTGAIPGSRPSRHGAIKSVGLLKIDPTLMWSVNGVSFSPEGARIATGGGEGTYSSGTPPPETDRAGPPATSTR